VDYEYDPLKNESNFKKHAVYLSEVAYFEWDTAIINEDFRLTYSEKRFAALGYIEQKLHVLIFCFRQEKIRVISLRKANRREHITYAKT
jgi:uncharacterized DUF497 family protein